MDDKLNKLTNYRSLTREEDDDSGSDGEGDGDAGGGNAGVGGIVFACLFAWDVAD